VEKLALTVVQIREVLSHMLNEQERLFALLPAVTSMRVNQGTALRLIDFNISLPFTEET
jgi:hypothetical protein